MKLTKRDVGRWCTIKYTDIGRIDGLITNVNTEYKYVDVFIPATDDENDAEFSQIIELREYVKPE